MTPCITLLRESELVDGGKNSERQVMLTWRATDDYKAGDLVDTPMSIPRQGLTYISTCFPSPQRSPPCKLHTERLLFEREAQIQDIAWSVENCQIAIAPGALNFGIAPWNIRSRYASAPFLLDDPSYNPYSKGWKTHKSTCNPHNEIKGIYFAAGESSPRLITVPLEYNHIPDPYSLATDVVKIPILQPLLGDGDHDGLPITHQGKAGKELKHPFRLFIRDNFLNDGSPPNHIPANLTKGKAPHKWAGNLLALKEESRGSSQWKNCSMNEDLPNLVKFFEWYGVKPTEAEVKIARSQLGRRLIVIPVLPDTGPTSRAFRGARW
jgi:hypothetical protein